MTNIVVGFPLTKAGNYYVNGLGISTGTTNLLVNLAAGSARDSSNQDDIILASSVIINSAKTGVNGLDTGTLAASTFYYVYVIASSLSANPEINQDIQVSTLASGTTILNGTVVAEGQVTQPTWSVANNLQPAGMISLSATTPTLPTGYDMFRRVGAILTDGASHILPFWQDQGYNSQGRKMWYDVPVSVLAATAAAAFTAQSLAAAVPLIAAQGTQTEVVFQADLLPNAAADFVELRPTGSTAANGNVKMSGDVAAVHHFDQLTAVAAVSAGAVSIDWITDAASTVALTVSSYVDKL